MKSEVIIDCDSNSQLACDDRDGQYFFAIEDLQREPDSKFARGVMIAVITSAVAWLAVGICIAWYFGRFPWQH